MMDIVSVLVGLVVLFPVLIILYFWVRHEMGRLIFFRQTCPGKDEQPFEMLKFRTMSNDLGKDLNPLLDVEWLTLFGAKKISCFVGCRVLF